MTRPALTEKLGKFNSFFGEPAPKTEVGVDMNQEKEYSRLFSHMEVSIQIFRTGISPSTLQKSVFVHFLACILGLLIGDSVFSSDLWNLCKNRGVLMRKLKSAIFSLFEVDGMVLWRSRGCY